MDLTLSLIHQVSRVAENGPFIDTCSMVKWLQVGWTWMGWKEVQGQRNGAECPLTSTPPSRESRLSVTGFEKSD